MIALLHCRFLEKALEAGRQHRSRTSDRQTCPICWQSVAPGIWALSQHQQMSENCKMWQRRQQHSQASAGQDAAPPAAVKAPAAPSGEPDRMSCPRCGRSIRAQDDWARYQHSEQCHPEFITADFSRACILQVQSGRREKARAKEEPVSAEGKGRARSSQKTAPKPKVREPHAVFDVCV